jgi:hypothetical protein
MKNTLQTKLTRDKALLRDMAQKLLRMSEQLEEVYDVNRDEVVKANQNIIASAVILEGIGK